jgi:hypothetical protein
LVVINNTKNYYFVYLLKLSSTRKKITTGSHKGEVIENKSMGGGLILVEKKKII